MSLPPSSQMGDAHAVDIETLAQQLKEELAAADAPAARPSSGCPIVIGEVGALTRNVDPVEYDPHHVSIGPYHRTKNPDLARDDEKVRCLRAVLLKARATLEAYLAELASIEGRARSCYASAFQDMDSAAFVRMLLLDGCYLLVRFGGDVGAPQANGHVQGGSYCYGGAPLADGDMMEDVAVVRDVFYLAENQIPFFVVEKIHELTFPDPGVSAADAIAGYVRKLLHGQQYSVATPEVRPPGPGNLLHLLHMHLTPTVLDSPTTGNKANGKRRVGRWRSATEYHCAGVGFRTRPLDEDGKDAGSIVDVKPDCRGGTLEVPCLNIDAETWRLLRNLMALEQRNAAVGSHVTAYCVFVSQLACTARDVELLSRRGVISHGLGSHNEVAELFTDLCKGVAFGADDPRTNYLSETWQELEGRFRSRPRRWAAWLMLRYFRNPWLAVGLAAAAAGLLCSVVQAVFAVLSYAPAT